MKIGKREIFVAVLAIFTIWFLYSFYYSISYEISLGSGTVLSDNWWRALNWIKNNTKDCAVIATYWDPGHFITGIANRSVIFDGASQNDLYTRKTDNPIGDGLRVEKYDNGINHIVLEKDGNITTARIQDIATTLLTSNETLAINILKDYKKCDEMYYIASSDLIFKSQWWTYFSTWDPEKICEGQLCKGERYFYFLAQLARRKPLLFANTYGYEYPITERQSFILYEENNTMRAVFQQDNKFVKIKKLVYFKEGNTYSVDDPNAEMGGMIIAPGYPPQIIFYVQEQLENSLFTRMYFFNGAGLKHFQFIMDWGTEVKLFKVIFEN